MKRLVMALALCLAACLPPPRHAHGAEWMRFTHYDFAGWMYSGAWTYPGAAACSWNLPLFTTVSVRGLRFVCEDRGELGDGYPYSWVDTYGDWGLNDYEAVETW